MEKHSFEDWFNRMADKNGYIELADNTEIIEEIGYWIQFVYPSGRKQWEFIFHEEIQN
jgi:hypothetical protein